MFWRKALSGIERELALMREDMAKGRDATERQFAEMVQFQREERVRANKVLEPLIASHSKLIASHDDLVSETRAQRDALFWILAELRGSDGRSGGTTT